MEHTKIIKESSELWEEISKVAQFRPNDYDAEFLTDIRNKLSLDDNKSIPRQLKNKHISIEELLAAFLQALQPLSIMLTDLFYMFEKARAQESDKKLIMAFDFNKSKEKYNLDLDSFRKIINTFQVFRDFIHIIFVADLPWEMHRILDQALPKDKDLEKNSHAPNDIIDWCYEYHKDTWPNFFPACPKCGIKTIDEKISKLWDVLKSSVNIYKAEFDASVGRIQSSMNIYNQRRTPFWEAETREWSWSFMTILEEISFIAIERRNSPTIQELQIALDNCIALVHDKEIKTTKSIDGIKDILALPFWERRYELYSAWVSTQIIKAFDTWDIHFNVINNTLSFSFGGSHIADCTKLNPPLQIWAELRTECNDIVSKKRKSHIQPDYTLAYKDVFIPKHSVAVIECKQYKKYNAKNFTEAVTDYANGRSEASVFLVNYTDIPAKAQERIKAKLPNRIPYFSRLHPFGTEDAEFRDALKAAVEQYYSSHFPDYFSIMLQWHNPSDLDLHLRITDSSNKQFCLNYNNPGSYTDPPFAVLYKDCRKGPGIELSTPLADP